ncbi:succinate dehydrogenase assembly factor 4, mitochondrial-like [Melia azedarach]|uniref:Succinate dehydrogenase assembly factor 4, mitochondrial-like n=1 Tax=Melia azedarach TaxID=155640 RepID=A0ACC1X450_MELAZ|nr:succinate dehydrogenase assembly factor 4, mitochondrial-like [Melia azedarach]
MAKNNLGRLFASISNLSATPKPFTRSESVTAFVSNPEVSRLMCSSTQQPQEKSIEEREEDTVKSGNEETENQEDEEDDDDHVNKETGEVGGPRGPEPTRYGDWERNGRCYDF